VSSDDHDDSTLTAPSSSSTQLTISARDLPVSALQNPSELIMGQKISRAANPIVRPHASIAVVRRDAAGNIKLDMEKSRRKIDGMAAVVDAVGAAIADPAEPRSV
jgi:phage terminase large subunit-like protein